MNVQESCRCGAKIEIEEPTERELSSGMRDTLADFRVGHPCPFRGKSSGFDDENVAAVPIIVAAAGYPSPPGVPGAAF